MGHFKHQWSYSSYNFNHTNITANQNYELQVTQGATVITKKFSAIVNPNVVSESMNVSLFDGITIMMMKRRTKNVRHRTTLSR
jgi:hypothetical protein